MTQAAGQNSHLTYKANRDIGRHGWLRLTPAYSVRLVREYIAQLGPGAVVTDPFSGTGTTPLAAAEHGVRGQSFDINPFLIWLGRAKTRHYDSVVLATASAYLAEVFGAARGVLGALGTPGTLRALSPSGRGGAPDLWQPPLANIERWWGPSALGELKALRAALDRVPSGEARDLLDIAFCRCLITASNAAFNHQSMSFKTPKSVELVGVGPGTVLAAFLLQAEEILAGASVDLPGDAEILHSDSRTMDAPGVRQCDLLLTSPPYVNRMSYIRELRPYMYWLRYLTEPTDASNLDWTAIGGTWGTATSRLTTWAPQEDTPITALVEPVCARIVRDGGKSGPLLANYVRKYFADMWPHFQAAYKHVRSGGRATYIVGNSTFYGNLVPVEEWYRILLEEAGFGPVTVTVIRKRNSNKQLWEFDVTAHKP